MPEARGRARQRIGGARPAPGGAARAAVAASPAAQRPARPARSESSGQRRGRRRDDLDRPLELARRHQLRLRDVSDRLETGHHALEPAETPVDTAPARRNKIDEDGEIIDAVLPGADKVATDLVDPHGELAEQPPELDHELVVACREPRLRGGQRRARLQRQRRAPAAARRWLRARIRAAPRRASPPRARRSTARSCSGSSELQGSDDTELEQGLLTGC